MENRNNQKICYEEIEIVFIFLKEIREKISLLEKHSFGVEKYLYYCFFDILNHIRVNFPSQDIPEDIVSFEEKLTDSEIVEK